MRLRNRLQDAQPREQFYDLDQLFLGYGLVFLNTRGAVEKLGDVLDRHPTWLACHAMFADALTHLAMDTGDDALMQRALRKSTATLEFAPDNRFALNASLYAHKCAIEFRQIHQKDWDDLEPNARQLAERLLKFPDFGLGHAMCGQVYDVLGHPAADETWMQVLEHGEEMWRWTAAARLYCDRPANELLKVLEQIEDLSIDKYALAAKAYVLTDVPGGKEEAMRIYKTLVKGQPSLVQCYNAVHILLLLGERDMARSAATRWVQESESRKDRTDSTDSEFQEERLLRIVASEELPDNGFHGHLEEVMSHHMLGLMATAKGDREAAENHFGKSIKKPHINIDHYWGEAFLKHMRADENWPRENPHMSGDQSQVSH